MALSVNLRVAADVSPRMLHLAQRVLTPTDVRLRFMIPMRNNSLEGKASHERRPKSFDVSGSGGWTAAAERP
jgi:hypothetical protein